MENVSQQFFGIIIYPKKNSYRSWMKQLILMDLLAKFHLSESFEMMHIKDTYSG